MATPNWITYRESTHGVNADGYPDVSNRPSRTIWSNFTRQHDKDGDHKSDLATGALKIEQGTYTGNSTDNRVITLTDTAIVIKFIRIFSAAEAYTYFASASMTEGFSLCTEGTFSIDWIRSILTTGQFTISDNAKVNQTGITYYYVVYGE